MQEAYRLIFINIFSLTLLITGVFLYRRVFPRKKISLWILLLLISLLPLISIMRSGTYESGDLSYHIKNTIVFYKSLSEGNIIPRWSDFACRGYGCPDFIFLYILPYYLTSFFHFIGFSFIASVKVLIATSFIASAVTIYLWMKDEFGNFAGFIAGTFYLYMPYHLVDMHFRNAIGELVAFALIPLCFLFTKKTLDTKEKRWIVVSAVAITLLILSHIAAALVTIPFLLIYGIVVMPKKKQKNLFPMIKLLFALLLGILLASFYWIPLALETKYIFYNSHSNLSFSNLNDLLYSPWRYGLLFQGPSGEQSHIVGYIQLTTVCIAIYFLIKKKISNLYEKSILLLFLISFFITFFMILPIAKPIWYFIPLIKSFGSTYRLLIFNGLCTSVIAAIVIKNIPNKKIGFALCFFAIVLTILNWGNRRTIPQINDSYFIHQVEEVNSDKGSYALPMWVRSASMNQYTDFVKNYLEIVSGQAEIHEIFRNSTKHEYLIDVLIPSTLRKNTFYFPGWHLRVNNKEYPFVHDYPIQKGTMYFTLPKGLYDVEFTFKDIFIQKLANVVSLLTAVLLAVILIVTRLRKK